MKLPVEFRMPVSEEFFIPEDKEYYTNILEQEFGMVYYGNSFSFFDVEEMPVFERLFLYKELKETKEKEYKEKKKAAERSESQARAARSRKR